MTEDTEAMRFLHWLADNRLLKVFDERHISNHVGASVYSPVGVHTVDVAPEFIDIALTLVRPSRDGW